MSRIEKNIEEIRKDIKEHSPNPEKVRFIGVSY